MGGGIEPRRPGGTLVDEGAGCCGSRNRTFWVRRTPADNGGWRTKLIYEIDVRRVAGDAPGEGQGAGQLGLDRFCLRFFLLSGPMAVHGKRPCTWLVRGPFFSHYVAAGMGIFGSERFQYGLDSRTGDLARDRSVLPPFPACSAVGVGGRCGDDGNNRGFRIPFDV